jgi:ABC-type antimicrobial peptide transport system ATPase subunit
VLEQVGLAEHQDKPVGALSGGMKQRLALGLALLADPPVLVMDEPTSNLDTAARSQLLQLLVQVKQAGKTIIFTSHRIEESGIAGRPGGGHGARAPAISSAPPLNWRRASGCAHKSSSSCPAISSTRRWRAAAATAWRRDATASASSSR